jgi:hypothetical protein
MAELCGAAVRLDTGESNGEFSRYLSRCGLPVVDTVTRMSLRRPWALAAAPSAAVYAVATHATG